jgi:HEAT repeat protein
VLRLALPLASLLLIAAPVAGDPDLEQISAKEVMEAAQDASKPARRAKALLELGRRHDARGVAVISSALTARQQEVRIAALRLAGTLGKHAQPLGEEIVQRAADREPRVRSEAAWALGHLAKDHAPWGRLLTGLLERDPDLRVRHQAARSLGRFPSVATSSLPVLVGAMESQPLSVAKGGAHGVRGLGSDARPVADRLRRLALGKRFPLARRQLALRALGGLGQWGAGALWIARQQVGLTVIADAELARSTLGRTLLDLDRVRAPRQAADRVATLRAYQREVLLTILPALSDLVRRGRHPVIRSGCASLLASLGKQAAPAAASLGQGLVTPGAEANALEALGGLRVEDLAPALPWIEAALQSGSDSQVLDLLRFLAQRPRLDRKAVELISDALQWGSEDVRAGAANALGALGRRSAPAIPVLKACLEQDASVKVRILAAGVLARLGGAEAQACRKTMESLRIDASGPLLEHLDDALARLAAEKQGK